MTTQTQKEIGKFKLIETSWIKGEIGEEYTTEKDDTGKPAVGSKTAVILYDEPEEGKYLFRYFDVVEGDIFPDNELIEEKEFNSVEEARNYIKNKN